jgi:hypothetical protein
MTPEELNKAVEAMKADGATEEDMLGAFYKMFQEDKITFEGLEALVEGIGYHITDEFRAMSDEDRKTKGYEEVEEEVSEEVKEEAKEAEPAAAAPESTASSSSEADEDNGEEEKKAMALFNYKR